MSRFPIGRGKVDRNTRGKPIAIRTTRKTKWVRTLAPLAWCIAGALHAQNAPEYTLNDFGEVGLLQTPTARMADEGEVGFDYSRIQPYSNFNVMGQPFPWLEGSFRYTIVSNRLNPKNSGSGTQSYRDKSIDVKLHLHQETRFLPSVVVGVRDLAGTGLFSSEYFAASKRAGPFDFSLGLAWGYLGGRGNLPNPFGWIDSSFNHRPVLLAPNTTGEFTISRYFHGPTALFGGVEYQTPWSWLRFKAELDGNNYKHEPFADNQVQRWPVNLGALFRVSRNVDVTLGYERGNTVMASLSLHDNLAKRTEADKPLDPPPEPLAVIPEAQADNASAPTGSTGPAVTAPAATDWAAVSRILEQNAGITVDHIAQRGSELLVYGEQKRFFYGPEGLGRAARLLNNRLDNSIDWITFVSENHGMPIVEDSVHRPRFVDLLDNRIDLPTFKRSVEQDATAPMQHEDVLYTKPLKRLELQLAPGYHQIIDSANAPYIYQGTLNGYATFHFDRNLWLDAEVDANLFNNFNRYKFDTPSSLPHVRTDMREYLVSSNVVMPNFQLTEARQLDTDLYAMAYAGMLESMFGGVGGEVLYRPMGDRWAFGVDANFVRQRGFKQDFSFRNYQVATGLATLYLNTGFYGMHAELSAGRYLAGDWGTTIDISHEFNNGTRMGAYATITTDSGKAFGEGSFDKGVYISVPLDLFLPWSVNRRPSILYEPLVRDGGARLNRSYELYDLTDDRDGSLFDQNLDKITH